LLARRPLSVMVRAVRVEAVDAILLRVLFIVTGVVLGAVTATSLVLTLRSWHILNVPPTVAALSSVGGACVFGAVWFLVERAGVRHAAMVSSAPRRIALILAMALFVLVVGCIVVITTSVGVATTVLRKMTFPGMLGCMLIAHGAGSVIVAELLRATIARTARWSDRRHFAGVGVVWVMMSAAGTFFLWRAWQKLTWP